MTDKEFEEFYFSLTDDERIEVLQKLSGWVKENREQTDFTDEFIAENDAKLERYNKVNEQK